MEPTTAPLEAAASVVAHVDTEIKLAAYIIGCVLIGFVFYMLKVAGDSKKLVAEKEKAEIERTEHRKAERDAQINGLAARVDAEIKDIREDFVAHVEKHKTEDNRLYDRLGKIEDNIHHININLAEIKTWIEFAKPKEGRHGHDE